MNAKCKYWFEAIFGVMQVNDAINEALTALKYYIMILFTQLMCGTIRIYTDSTSTDSTRNLILLIVLLLLVTITFVTLYFTSPCPQRYIQILSAIIIQIGTYESHLLLKEEEEKYYIQLFILLPLLLFLLSCGSVSAKPGCIIISSVNAYLLIRGIIAIKVQHHPFAICMHVSYLLIHTIITLLCIKLISTTKEAFVQRTNSATRIAQIHI